LSCAATCAQVHSLTTRCRFRVKVRNTYDEQGTLRYCELGILTPRSSDRQTRLPSQSTNRCGQCRAPCGGGGRHTVRLKPRRHPLSTSACALKKQQEVEEGGRSCKEERVARCSHNLRECKCGEYRDTYGRDEHTQPLGHMTTCFVCTHMLPHTRIHIALL
jgi:hypothetical protein